MTYLCCLNFCEIMILLFMNLFKMNESVYVYDLYRFICKIVGLVVGSNTKAFVAIVCSAYPLITSAKIYHSALY